jgi:predicted HicB family RNase H-like nuclease
MGNDKFIVTTKTETKEDSSVTMTIRIDRALQEQLDLLANKSKRSRNELINMALNYAIENIEIMPPQE